MSINVIDQWNNAAKAFSEEQERSFFARLNKAIVARRFTELHGEKVLDLGSGYGVYTDYLRSIGGDVIGIDGAQAMVDIAKEKYPDCTFMIADITRPLPFEDDSFDIVFCNQVLMDIENVETVLKECKRVLKSGGILHYSIVHPAFFGGNWTKDKTSGKNGKLISSYLTKGISENTFWGSTTHYHRPLSYYLNAASDAGLTLIHTKEPPAYENKDRNSDLPLFFFAEYRK